MPTSSRHPEIPPRQVPEALLIPAGNSGLVSARHSRGCKRRMTGTSGSLSAARAVCTGSQAGHLDRRPAAVPLDSHEPPTWRRRQPSTCTRSRSRSCATPIPGPGPPPSVRRRRVRSLFNRRGMHPDVATRPSSSQPFAPGRRGRAELTHDPAITDRSQPALVSGRRDLSTRSTNRSTEIGKLSKF